MALQHVDEEDDHIKRWTQRLNNEVSTASHIAYLNEAAEYLFAILPTVHKVLDLEVDPGQQYCNKAWAIRMNPNAPLEAAMWTYDESARLQQLGGLYLRFTRVQPSAEMKLLVTTALGMSHEADTTAHSLYFRAVGCEVDDVTALIARLRNLHRRWLYLADKAGLGSLRCCYP